MNNSIDFGARIYDNRLGRFYSVDPITYPYWSPFQYDGNSPIFIKDVLGMGIGDPQKVAARQDNRYSKLEKRLSRKYSGDKLQYELQKRGSKKRYGSIIGKQKAGLFTGKLDKNNSATGSAYEEVYDNRKSIYKNGNIKTAIVHTGTRMGNEGEDVSTGPVTIEIDNVSNGEIIYLNSNTLGGYQVSVSGDQIPPTVFDPAPQIPVEPGKDPNVMHFKKQETKKIVVNTASNVPVTIRLTFSAVLTKDGATVHQNGYAGSARIATVGITKLNTIGAK